MFRLPSIPSVLLTLGLILHCTQMCVAAGFAHASASAVHSSAIAAHDAPCHSAPSPISAPSEECASCQQHAFLKAASPGVDRQGAATALSFVLPLQSSALQGALHFSVVPAEQQPIGRCSLPLYLSLSVLRF